MKKTKKRKKNLNKNILILLAIIILAIIIIIAHFTTKKKTTDITNHEYKSNINDISNTLFELPEDELDNIIILENEIDNVITENNEVNTIETNTVKNQDTSNNTSNNTSQGTKYKLEVNCTANVVNVYEKDETNGKYTNCVKVMLCSVGGATPTSGTYTLRNYRGNSWRWRPLFGNVYGQYATQITGNILFHSVPYTKPNNSSLEYWEYDKLGTSASMGCVRLTTQNAKWIWDNCVTGTKVTFYNDTNPGPLGKPTEAKISWNEECRNWDPTDPSDNNPWKTYNSQKPQVTSTPSPTPTPTLSPSPVPSSTPSPTPSLTPTPTPPKDNNETKDDPEVSDNSIKDPSNNTSENIDNNVAPNNTL